MKSIKFNDFNKIHEMLIENGVINESMDKSEMRSIVKDFILEEQLFTDVFESISEGLDTEILESINEEVEESINEAYAFAFIKSPIKATKLMVNSGKLSKAYIQKAVIDLDFEKMKMAQKKKEDAIQDPAKKKVFKEKVEAQAKTAEKAKDLKLKAATDLISDIKQRMDDLAGTDDKLKKLAGHLKTKASLKANKKLFKAADGEQQKQLGLEIKKQEKKIADNEREFTDYDKELSDKEKKKAEKKAEEAELEANADRSNDAAEGGDKPKTKEKTEETPAADSGKGKENTDDGNDEDKKVKELKDKVKRFKDKVESGAYDKEPDKKKRFENMIKKTEEKIKDLEAGKKESNFEARYLAILEGLNQLENEMNS